jgi:hypothetical protein
MVGARHVFVFVMKWRNSFLVKASFWLGLVVFMYD